MRTWTIEDLLDIADESHRYEVVDGRLVVSPLERLLNVKTGHRLGRQLDPQLPAEWAAMRETGIRLGRNGRIPDLIVARLDGPAPLEQVGLDAADVCLAVEIVSPSSRRRDRAAKPAEYAAAGIPAFWRLETDPELVLHTFLLQDGGYVPGPVLTGVGEVRCPYAVTIDVPALLGPGT